MRSENEVIFLARPRSATGVQSRRCSSLRRVTIWAALGSAILWCSTPLIAQGAPQAKAEAPGSERIAAVFGDSSISWDEFYLELARRHRGTDLGKEALDHLIQSRVVALESDRRKIRVSDKEIDQYVASARAELRKNKMSLDAQLVSRGMTMAEFRDFVRLSRTYDRLVRQDLKLAAGVRPTAAQRKLWMSERRRKLGVKVDVRKLATDVAAVIDGKIVTLGELGLSMTRTLRKQERISILRQMIAYRLLQREAARLGVTITPKDHEAALDRKRREYERNAQLRKLGVNLEQLLAAQGRSIEDLRQGEVFRAEVLIGVLGKRMFPDAKLVAASNAEPAKWEARVGEAREVSRILLGGKPRRSLDKAKDLLTKIRSKLSGASDFAPAARQFSEDTSSKRKGGKLGWIHKDQRGLDKALVEAAFRLDIGKISKPIASKDGWSLLLVHRARPAPTGRSLIEAMRQYEVAQWLRNAVEAAKIDYRPLPRKRS